MGVVSDGQTIQGVVNLDITKSVPDWEAYAQPIAPEDAPSVLYI
jgi:hypothetical protein